jgi:hypothetical protein
MILTLFFWLLAGGAAPLPAAAAGADLLPPDGFLQTWKRSSGSRIFTSSDLYGYIDGGAEIFLELGFAQLSVQPYKPAAGSAASAEDEFKVEIYRMTDPVAAAGIYLLNCGKEAPDPSLPVRHTLNRYQLIFKRERYYVIVNNSEGNEKLRPAMLEFARYVAARLPAEVPVKIDEILPRQGLVKNSVRLFRGPYGLQSIYTLGHGDILQQGRKLTGVSGNYQEAGVRYTLVLVDYPDEQTAQKAYANVGTNLDSYLKVQEKNARRLVFRDFNNEFGAISVAGKRLTIQLHLSQKPF